ncbi:MAG: hypothetical protein GY711_05945 [bacterium]|nr:hypothetical protein [bacterium]
MTADSILDPSLPELAPHLERGHPYLAALLERAGRRALRMHADEVTVEHVFGACMEDEDSAAHQVVVHAFADPETLDVELLALSPGTMVVASGAALPFSPLALDALRAARGTALESGASVVSDASVMLQCVAALPEDVANDLASAGYDATALAATAAETSDDAPAIDPDSALFRHFTDAGKRALSLANKAAFAAREPSIGPARLVAGLLAAQPALETQSGLTGSRASNVLNGRTVDPSPIPHRPLPPGEDLAQLLRVLPSNAGSIEILIAGHSSTTGELRELLQRHKVTESLLERAREAFHDPDSPSIR